MKIIKTSLALKEGNTFVSEHHCKKWQKFCVIEEESGLIIVTADSQKECEKFMLYLRGVYVTPEFFKAKVKMFWRRKI